MTQLEQDMRDRFKGDIKLDIRDMGNWVRVTSEECYTEYNDKGEIYTNKIELKI